MKQYKEALRTILREGTWQHNRTGIDTIKSPRPIIMQFHMDAGYPAITGRRAPVKSAFSELVGFLRGKTSAADFRALGTKYWDANANLNKQWLENPFRMGEDDLGDVYGAQWRRWPAYKELKRADFLDDGQWQAAEEKLRDDGWHLIANHEPGDKHGDIWFKEIDQLAECVRKLIEEPNDRRILFHAWNPAKLDEIALPACHLLYQFVPSPATKELALSITIRSNDMPLGYPSNVMEGAAMLCLVARLTGYKPTWLTTISNDAHIYRNQLKMVEEYLERHTHDLVSLQFNERVPTYEKILEEVRDVYEGTGMSEEFLASRAANIAMSWLDEVEPTDFLLPGYVSGEPITAAMAV